MVTKSEMKFFNRALCLCFLVKLSACEGSTDHYPTTGTMNKYLQRIRNHNAMGDLTHLFLPWTTGPSKRAPIHLWKRSDLADEHPKLYTAEELLQLMNSADEDESF